MRDNISIPNIMAKKNYFIQDGLIVSKSNSDKDEAGLFSFTKFFRRMLKRFNIAFTDDCCDPDLENLPVRYNSVEDQLERYDPETDAWVAVA